MWRITLAIIFTLLYAIYCLKFGLDHKVDLDVVDNHVFVIECDHGQVSYSAPFRLSLENEKRLCK